MAGDRDGLVDSGVCSDDAGGTLQNGKFLFEIGLSLARAIYAASQTPVVRRSLYLLPGFRTPSENPNWPRAETAKGAVTAATAAIVEKRMIKKSQRRANK